MWRADELTIAILIICSGTCKYLGKLSVLENPATFVFQRRAFGNHCSPGFVANIKERYYVLFQ